jgi:hypothetical protein
MSASFGDPYPGNNDDENNLTLIARAGLAQIGMAQANPSHRRTVSHSATK